MPRIEMCDVARPIARAVLDVALPPDEHTLSVKVYRGKASSDVAARPGELLCRIDARCVIVLAFLGASVAPPAKIAQATALVPSARSLPMQEEGPAAVRRPRD